MKLKRRRGNRDNAPHRFARARLRNGNLYLAGLRGIPWIMRAHRRRSRRTFSLVPSSGLIVLILLALATSPVAAQTVGGVARDADTEEPLEGVELVLRNERGSVVSGAETGSDGRFVLSVRSAGPYTLEATRFGYAPVAPTAIDVGRELVEVEVRLSPSPVELEPLVVLERRPDPKHEATFEGAMARYEQLPSAGWRRVVLRSDAEFVGAMRVTDILRWFPQARGCRIVFSEGRVATTAETARMWLAEASPSVLEAVEFYRTWSDAPMGLRDVPPYVFDPTGCAVVAVWMRRDPPPPGSWWRRTLTATAAFALVYLVSEVWFR